jgi:hypothetical protein
MAHDARCNGDQLDIFTRFFRAWERFFFAPADPTPLAVVRICGGLVILYIHLTYCFDLQAFFGKDAWINLETINELRREVPTSRVPIAWPPSVPQPQSPLTEEELHYLRKWDLEKRYVLAEGNWKWSLWYHLTDPTWMAICHGGILLAMLCLTIGFCTRIAAVISWIGLLSYVNRAPTSLFGMDTIMIVVALYLTIGPSGAALSIDRLIERWRARKGWGGSPAAFAWPPPPQVSANLALRLLQIHVCIIYFASGISKLQGSTWWMGTAVWGTMANYEFSPMDSAIYMAYLRFLAERRWLWELVITAGTTFTLAFEIAFAFVVWTRPMRWLMIISAVLLHTGIALFMGLVGFSLMMMVCVLSFVPAEATHAGLERLDRWWRTLARGPESAPASALAPETQRPAVKLSRSA